jgi:hypothetical protein
MVCVAKNKNLRNIDRNKIAVVDRISNSIIWVKGIKIFYVLKNF